MDLTALSQATRKIIIFLAIGIVVWIITLLVFNLALRVIKNLTPEQAPTADQLFGNLEKTKFKQPVISSSQFTYALETIDSKPPTMPALEYVYKLVKPSARFLSLEQAKNQARDLGFTEEPQMQSNETYAWTDNDLPGYKLTINIINGNISLRSDPTKLAAQFSPSLHIDSNEAVTKVRNYLNNRIRIPPLLEKGETKVQFLNVSASQTRVVNSADQANNFRVDLFPGKINDEYVILNQTPQESVLNVTLFTNKEGADRPLEINYQPFLLDTNDKATYNIKNSDQAWRELLSGQGVVIKTPLPNGNIAIKAITLGYFLEESSEYLKPVYIFEGITSPDKTETDFVAVLPAIASPNKSK